MHVHRLSRRLARSLPRRPPTQSPTLLCHLPDAAANCYVQQRTSIQRVPLRFASTSTSPAARQAVTSSVTHSQAESSRQQQQNAWNRLSRPLGFTLFISVAVFTTYLGKWQLERRQWKIGVIAEREAALNAAPADVDQVIAGLSYSDGAISADNVQRASFHNVTCSNGRFDYTRQHFIGPRPPPAGTSAADTPGNVGYYVITPYVTADGNTVMVNRGWVSKQMATTNNITHETSSTITGVLRPTEARPQYLPATSTTNNSAGQQYIYLDLPHLAAISTGNTNNSNSFTSQLYIEQHNANTNRATGKTEYPLRRSKNDLLQFQTTPMIHSVYAGTWFTLSAALLALTVVRFRR